MENWVAATTSTGSTIRPRASESRSRQVATMSSSSSDFPTSWPWALRNVKHMPPPTSSLSTFGSSDWMTASLSETLAPPSTTTYGCSGFSEMRLSTSTSRSTRPPA
jgi:hypothetical protein